MTDPGNIRRRLRQARPALDMRRLAAALSGPGVDTRTWFAQGTVGVHREDGTWDFEDPEAVYVDDEGALISVRLEPEDAEVTARWNGVGAGRFGVIYFPIYPGDEVLVAIPGGDLSSSAIAIVTVMSNLTAPTPETWANDRVLMDLRVPLEIRGPAVRIRSGNLELNGRAVAFSTEAI